MESGRDKKSDSQAGRNLSSSSLPYGGGLLGQQYFDSGDLALSAADIVTDNGAIQTGAAHPIRESISRPYAPVPNTSNANKDANRELGGNKSPTPEMIDSPLHQQIDSGKKEM
ncbi:hypothetical protein BDV38DRAFT_276154 [Aspergillus pseudotamarii]|uniref:mRNA stability protein n=1 Tax=Aspergillus pseudotamarii TaxID=132259 RepID=A0A5N6SDN0_ASPPS|nr:uncharacterized protein BDV38DRAFT_276154 [Aspergillus pseudotamarii]KAE8131204.1 hypothetical protein BDV38DRAFT_276154 [Aspergillus pseudotamarii]